MAFLFTTDIRFVNFNNAAELVSTWANHRPSQLMQPCPCRSVAAEPECVLEIRGTGAVPLGHDRPHHLEPETQRLMGVLENCPRRNRRLAATGRALEKFSRMKPSLLGAATGADESRWPPHAD